jgi:hypothetical protein
MIVYEFFIFSDPGLRWRARNGLGPRKGWRHPRADRPAAVNEAMDFVRVTSAQVLGHYRLSLALRSSLIGSPDRLRARHSQTA